MSGSVARYLEQQSKHHGYDSRVITAVFRHRTSQPVVLQAQTELVRQRNQTPLPGQRQASLRQRSDAIAQLGVRGKRGSHRTPVLARWLCELFLSLNTSGVL